jgi:hypothetical protein
MSLVSRQQRYASSRITRAAAGPWFRNMLTALEFDGRAGRIRFDQSVSETAGHPRLQPAGEARLS